MSAGPTGLLAHFRRALPMLVVGVCLSALLGHYECLARYDDAALDSYLLLRSPKPVDDIVIVEITDDDYQKLFDGRSPLDGATLASLVRAIQSGRPSLLVVDVDTSGQDAGQRLSGVGCAPRIVWGQDGVVADNGIAPVPFSNSGHVASPCSSGLAVFPQDVDGVVRRYRRFVTTTGGANASTLPFAAVQALRAEPGDAPGAEGDELILNFSGDRYAFQSFTASQVLAGAEGPAWISAGPLVGRVVVLGGIYRAARDEYTTPVGRMGGVHLVAQALASELHHGGIREAREWSKIAVEVVVGLLVILLHFVCQPAVAVALSALALPAGALIGSWLVFSTLGYWVAFTPLVACVLLDQVWAHLRHYGELKQRVGQLSGENERLEAAVAAFARDSGEAAGRPAPAPADGAP